MRVRLKSRWKSNLEQLKAPNEGEGHPFVAVTTLTSRHDSDESLYVFSYVTASTIFSCAL